jgi:hypothetical protein
MRNTAARIVLFIHLAICVSPLPEILRQASQGQSKIISINYTKIPTVSKMPPY